MHIASVTRRLTQLPYPWCTPEDVVQNMPALEELQLIGAMLAFTADPSPNRTFRVSVR